MHEPLTEDQAATLAGGPVLDVETARGVEPVTDEDVAAAQAEAAQAEADADALERRAVTDPAVDLTEVAAVREISRFSRLRAAVQARRAERSKQAARLLALADVGVGVDALVAEASQPDRPIAQAARNVAQAAAAMRQLAAEHDRKVQELTGRAKSLGVEPAAPSGPRASSAHVAAGHDGNSVQHGRTRVRVIGEAVGAAITKAAAGDPDGATALLTAAHEQAPLHRQAGYFISRAGHVFGMDGPIGDGIRAQLVNGDLRQLTAREVDRYLNGRLHGHDSTPDPAA